MIDVNYKELIFTIISAEDYVQDLLIDALSAIGFDTFEETDLGFKAYIPSAELNEDRLKSALQPFNEQAAFTYEINLIPHKNWNELWESNFEPLIIGETCYVRATFHESEPQYKYEIVIDPKMAFGTGHHQTTEMMMQYLLELDVAGKTVLDMGCGTGILAILADKLGASEITAIDFDPVCYESTIENTTLNNCRPLEILCGSKESIPEKKFDIIIANINRNILLDQIDRYKAVLSATGILLLSGFYEEPDLEIIKQKAFSAGLQYKDHKICSKWVSARFINH